MHFDSQPSVEEVRRLPQLHVSHHPVVKLKLTQLRRVETGEKAFAELVTELSWLLGYEAMADLATQPVTIKSPMETMEGQERSERLAIIPILRAGLGMVPAFRQLAPDARVWHLGMFRDEETLEAIEYYNRLPKLNERHACFILDPMLASGGQVLKAVEILKARGAERIKYVGLIAAPYGVKKLVDRFPEVAIHVAALDRRLNDRGYILPGLGDAGDRQFDLG